MKRHILRKFVCWPYTHCKKQYALRVALDTAHDAKAALAEVSNQKAAYNKKYSIFRKLLSASNKSTPLSETVDWIDKIVVDTGGKIMVE